MSEVAENLNEASEPMPSRKIIDTFIERYFRLKRVEQVDGIEQDVWVGYGYRKSKQVYGGQLIGQSMYAAFETLETKFMCNALHVFFIRPGDESLPFHYHVDRIRDGRGFCTREVSVIQNEKLIFRMMASFSVEEQGHEHQMPMPEVMPPKMLRTYAEVKADFIKDFPAMKFGGHDKNSPIEIRPSSRTSEMIPQSLTASHSLWFKYIDKISQDDDLSECSANEESADNNDLEKDKAEEIKSKQSRAQLHQCLFAYMSDMALMRTSVRPHSDDLKKVMMKNSSLDHTIYFHRSFEVDEWLWYNMFSPVSANGRGYQRAEVFTEKGVLVASVNQESLMRLS